MIRTLRGFYHDSNPGIVRGNILLCGLFLLLFVLACARYQPAEGVYRLDRISFNSFPDTVATLTVSQGNESLTVRVDVRELPWLHTLWREYWNNDEMGTDSEPPRYISLPGLDQLTLKGR